MMGGLAIPDLERFSMLNIRRKSRSGKLTNPELKSPLKHRRRDSTRLSTIIDWRGEYADFYSRVEALAKQVGIYS